MVRKYPEKRKHRRRVSRSLAAILNSMTYPSPFSSRHHRNRWFLTLTLLVVVVISVSVFTLGPLLGLPRGWLGILATPPQINFTPGTPSDGTVTNIATHLIGIDIFNMPDLKEAKLIWDGSDYTLFDDGLVLLANLDNNPALGESDTFAADSSRYGNDLMIYGATWTSSGRYGSGLNFDGIDDFVSRNAMMCNGNPINPDCKQWIYWQDCQAFEYHNQQCNWIDEPSSCSGSCGENPDCSIYSDINQCLSCSGCEWSSGWCSGQCSGCNSQCGSDKDCCDSYPGCQWMWSGGGCSGTCSGCESLSESTCYTYPGCSWTPGSCSGTCSGCENVGESDCGTTYPGCSWTPGSCGGGTCDCSTKSESECNGACGGICSWDTANCEGNHNSCGTYADEPTCMGHGCMWDGYYCYGDPHPCSTWDYSETDCNNHGEGCYWDSANCEGGTCDCSTKYEYECNGACGGICSWASGSCNNNACTGTNESAPTCDNSCPSGCSWDPFDCSGTATCQQVQEYCNAEGGCTWNANECSGTLTCGGQTNSNACSAITSCSWDADPCTGTPSSDCSQWNDNKTACQLYNNHYYECTWSGGCSGTMCDCGNFNDAGSCGIAGCTWYGDYCSGSCSCENLPTQSICTAGACTWDTASCSGTLTCDAQESLSACSFIGGCSWTGDCSGNLTCAAQNSSSSQCTAVSGCSFSGGCDIYQLIVNNNPFLIGYDSSSKYFNGTLDEVMVFSKLLNNTEVSDIYNNQSARFLGSGYQQYSNISITPGNTTVNVSVTAVIPSGTGINLTLQYYYNGSWQNAGTQQLSDGANILTYNISPDATNLSLNYTFAADSQNFLTPVLMNDTVVETFTPPLTITILSPISTTYLADGESDNMPTDIIINYNITLDREASWCGFAIYAGGTNTLIIGNTTMTLNSSSTGANYGGVTNLSSGDYYAVFSCNDTNGNMNSVTSDVFAVGGSAYADNCQIVYSGINLETGSIVGSTQDIDFEFNVSNPTDLTGCNIYIDSQIANSTDSVSSRNKISYNFGSGIENGTHEWKIVCKNPDTNCQRNSSIRTFTVINTTGFEGSTDLTSPTPIIEKPSYGKIVFSTDANFSSITGNEIPTYITISPNRIEINSSALPSLNVSANLTLYGLTFVNPRILKDGVPCSDCTIISYTGGNLTFTVTGFSYYSAAETPITPTTQGTTASGGGGGGAGSPPYPVGIVATLLIDKGVIPQISAGRCEKVAFTKTSQHGIMWIELCSRSNASNVGIYIQKNEISVAPGISYSRIEIINDALRNNITSATISMAVNKTWIANNRINPRTIRLYKYDKGTDTWSDMGAVEDGESSAVRFYKVTLSNFGIFAITGETGLCPKCPDPEEWGICVEGQSSRVEYICNVDTGFGCKERNAVKPCENVLICPTCPEPSEWSECVNGTNTRVEYVCSADTGYLCRSMRVTKACVVVSPLAQYGAWISCILGRGDSKECSGTLIGAVAGIIVIIVIIVIAAALAHMKKSKRSSVKSRRRKRR